MAVAQRAAPSAIASTALLSFISGFFLGGRLGGVAPVFHATQDWQQRGHTGVGSRLPLQLRDIGQDLSDKRAAETFEARGRPYLHWTSAKHARPRSLEGNLSFKAEEVFSKDNITSVDDGMAVEERTNSQDLSSHGNEEGISVEEQRDSLEVSSITNGTAMNDGAAVNARLRMSDEDNGNVAANSTAVNERAEGSYKKNITSEDDISAVEEKVGGPDLLEKPNDTALEDSTAVEEKVGGPEFSRQSNSTSVDDTTTVEDKVGLPKGSKKGNGAFEADSSGVEDKAEKSKVFGESNRSFVDNGTTEEETAEVSGEGKGTPMDEGTAKAERQKRSQVFLKFNSTSVDEGATAAGDGQQPEKSSKSNNHSLHEGTAVSDTKKEQLASSKTNNSTSAPQEVPQTSGRSNVTALSQGPAVAATGKEPEVSGDGKGTSPDDGHAAEEDKSAEDEETLAGKSGFGGLTRAEEEGEEFLKEAGLQEDPSNVKVERAIASMTLGSVAFQMSLFYLANHRDMDMRRYSYGVIGETISIFCAVLTFNACYAWIEHYIHVLEEKMMMAMLAGMCALFYITMEVVVACSARQRGENAQKHSKIHGKELHILRHVMNAKTFGAGAAQMCGAACIRGFGHLQFRAYQDYGSVMLTCAVIPLALSFFVTMMWLSTEVRRRVIYCDGTVDDTELTWVQVAEECENEVCGLCMGFLMATVARVLLTDSLPYILLHGFEHAQKLEVSTFKDTLGLLATGFICACITIGLVLMTFGLMESKIDHDTIQSGFCARSLFLCIKILGFSFSWCLCFGMHLFAIQIAVFKEGIRLRLILALVQSMMSLGVISLLDCFSDMECTGAAFDKAIVTLIETLAVSIGLSWEHAFHECVDITVEFMVEDKTVFKASKDPKLWSMCLSALIVITVLPAYRLYIVPTRCQLLEECEEKMKREEQIYRQSVLVTSSRNLQGRQEQTFQFNAPPQRHG